MNGWNRSPWVKPTNKRKSRNPSEKIDSADADAKNTCVHRRIVDFEAMVNKLLHEKRFLEEENRALTEKLNCLSARLSWFQESTEAGWDTLHRQLKRESYYYLLGLLHAILIREPDNLQAMANLAAVFVDLGFHHKAADVLETILEKEPNNEEARRDLSMCKEYLTK